MDPSLGAVLTAAVADGRTTALIEASRRGHVKVRCMVMYEKGSG